MPVKQRSSVGEETFDTQGAIDKLTGGQAVQQRSAAGEEQAAKTKEKRKLVPTSFYLDRKTLKKLDALASQYNEEKDTDEDPVRINRNHIIRFLASQVDLGMLLRVDLREFGD